MFGRRSKDFRATLLFHIHYPKGRFAMGNQLTVLVDDTGAHKAVLGVVNLDGSPAVGVTVVYSSDTPGVATIDPASGALTLVAAGVANITGTGTRGAFAHSDSGVLTVVVDPNTGDFTATLTLS